MSHELIRLLRSKPPLALVGASNRPEKFGNIILKTMRARDYTILPINSAEKEIEGLQAFPNLTEAAQRSAIGLVVYVVPPPRTLRSLAEARSLGLLRVWIQPGASDAAVVDYLERNGFQFLVNACVMVEG
ncbi:MAG: CoA-binding protein [Leptospirales bacterium]|nr:CoA-binding protein [Leptospirales bacterium]